eukprot:COSAG01_NODE_25696_length_736_cov_4.538462_2_plen_113_part_00
MHAAHPYDVCIDALMMCVARSDQRMCVLRATGLQWVLGPATACGGADGAALSGAPRERHGGGGCHRPDPSDDAREASPPRSLPDTGTTLELPPGQTGAAEASLGADQYCPIQ